MGVLRLRQHSPFRGHSFCYCGSAPQKRCTKKVKTSNAKLRGAIAIATIALCGVTACSQHGSEAAKPASPAPSAPASSTVKIPPNARPSESEKTPASATTEAQDSTKSGGELDFDKSKLQQVSSANFSADGPSEVPMFVYSAAGKKSECFFSQGYVTCFGTADASVQEVEVPPFPKQKPSAIMLGSKGAAYTLAEGGPPAQVELKQGQWVDFGQIACGKPDAAGIVCKSLTAAFAIEGADREIRTSGKVFASAEQLRS